MRPQETVAAASAGQQGPAQTDWLDCLGEQARSWYLTAGRLRDHHGPVVVGIRPSDFEDAEVWRDESRAVLEVTVDVVEDLGADSNVIFGLNARPAVDPAGGRTPQEEGRCRWKAWSTR